MFEPTANEINFKARSKLRRVVTLVSPKKSEKKRDHMPSVSLVATVEGGEGGHGVITQTSSRVNNMGGNLSL